MYVHEELLKLAAAKIIQQRMPKDDNKDMQKKAFNPLWLLAIPNLYGVGSQIVDWAKGDTPYDRLKKLMQLQQTQAMMGAMGMDVGNPLEGLQSGYHKNYMNTARQGMQDQFQDDLEDLQSDLPQGNQPAQGNRGLPWRVGPFDPRGYQR